MAILETKDLTRRFGTLTAVDGPTLSVETREVFSLLGRNGARKSTAIKMLTTLLALLIDHRLSGQVRASASWASARC